MMCVSAGRGDKNRAVTIGSLVGGTQRGQGLLLSETVKSHHPLVW